VPFLAAASEAADALAAARETVLAADFARPGTSTVFASRSLEEIDSFCRVRAYSRLMRATSRT